MGVYYRNDDDTLLCISGNIVGGKDSLSKNGNSILLTRADGTYDSVNDNDTIYTFEQDGNTLNIKGTDGTDESFSFGGGGGTIPEDSTTTFNSNGTITEKFADHTCITTFNADGSITEKRTYTDGTVKTTTTTFSGSNIIVKTV